MNPFRTKSEGAADYALNGADGTMIGAERGCDMATVRKTITLTEQERVVRQALIEGERSGTREPFDFKAFKRRKSQQHG